MNKRTMKATKRLICLVLCLLCLLAAVPLSAIAEGEATHDVETCTDGCTGENCLCSCHTSVEPAAHIDTCLDGCTGENCTCSCHESQEPSDPDVAEQNNKEENSTDGGTLSFFDQLTNCKTCAEMVALLDAATPEELATLDEDDLTALIGHVQNMEDDEAAKENLISELTTLKDGYAATIPSGWQPGGGSSSSNGRYYHCDFRVDATVTVKVLKADGTIAEETVSATASSPTAVIYNTGSTSWTGTGTTSEGVAYKSVSFNSSVSSAENEYMDSNRSNQFYEGDTVVLTYTLSYKTSDGTSHTVQLTETRVFDQDDNECSKKNATDSQRGFDIVVSAEDISTAMTNSQLQISKAWNDNNNAQRPDSITVKVYQAVNGVKNHYMTLVLNKNKSSSTYGMADGYTADKDMKVEFTDSYGVKITGLPANHWANSNGDYTFVSCSYSVDEVMITDASGTISPVYGSFVYVDNTETNSYIISITNTLAYEKLAVKKVWADSESDNHDGDSVKVKLTAYCGENEQVPDAWLMSFIGGNTEVTLNKDNSWYHVLGYMPVYYTEDGKSTPITGFKIEETEVDVDNGETYTATCSGISGEKDSGGNYYFTVTNTPKPKSYDLTVKKTISGNMTDRTEKFQFTVTYGDKTETFDLGHEGTKTISVPVGAFVKITEEPGSFEYSLTSVEPKTVVYTPVTDGSGISFTMPESNVTITIDNKLEAKIETGIILDALPYILILAIVAGGVVLMLLRKRRSYED